MDDQESEEPDPIGWGLQRILKRYKQRIDGIQLERNTETVEPPIVVPVAPPAAEPSRDPVRDLLPPAKDLPERESLESQSPRLVLKIGAEIQAIESAAPERHEAAQGAAAPPGLHGPRSSAQGAAGEKPRRASLGPILSWAQDLYQAGAPPRGRLALLLLTLAIACTGLATVRFGWAVRPPALFQEWRRRVHRWRHAPQRLALPMGHTAGLAQHEGSWITVDWLEQRVFAFDGESGEVLYVQPFPNPYTAGLSAGQESVWSLDSFNHRILRHDILTFAVQASFPSPGPGPSAIHWDGRYLWSADKELRRVYQHRAEGKLPVVAEYPLLEVEPAGLWWAQGYLWVLDKKARGIRRYSVSPEFAPGDRLDLSDWFPEGSEATGLALFESQLWIIADNPSALYKKNLEHISWSRGP